MTGNRLKRIIMADDEPGIQAVAKLALEAGGYLVEACRNGVELLEKTPGFAPDLIMLDVIMPEMDGVTTLKELRKKPETENVPIIFVTANIQPDEVSRYKRLGVTGVIPKPIDPSTFADQIRAIWNRRFEDPDTTDGRS